MEINETSSSPVQNSGQDDITNKIPDELVNMPAIEPKISKFSVGTSRKKKVPLKSILIGVFTAIAVFLLVWFFFLRGVLNDKNIDSTDKITIGSDEYNEFIHNPLTGEIIPPSQAKNWVDERPIGVMVNNHTDARPQSGLYRADLVYEIVAEGGITRFLAFFLSDLPEKAGPVRSTREYYLVLVKELGDAMIMHEGYSPQAKEAIDTWPVRSLFRGGASAVANWRDNPRNVAFEHTLYTDVAKLREHGDSLGWEGKRDFYTWKFKEGKGIYDAYAGAVDITIDFWYPGDYSAIFKYDTESNSYLRFMGYDDEDNPIPHKDQETDVQIKAANLIVQFVAESPVEGDDKSRLEYDLIGSGTGLVFIDGKVIDATWTKEERDARTVFYDSNGQEIEFNRGKVWISIVPDRNVEQVVYK